MSLPDLARALREIPEARQRQLPDAEICAGEFSLLVPSALPKVICLGCDTSPRVAHSNVQMCGKTAEAESLYQRSSAYCGPGTAFPQVISGLRNPIAIQAAISLSMNLPE
jgi:hypothetical protein